MSSNAGGRRKDENWKHVTQEDGKWRCKHCRMVFSGKISVTRIKAHLNKEKGKGVATCSKFAHDKDGVPDDMASGSSNPPQEPVIITGSIQGEASLDRPQEGVQGHALTSGLESQDHMSGLVNDQNNAVSGFSHLPNGMDASIFLKDPLEPEITHLNQLLSGLESDKGDIEQYIHQLEGEGKKRKRDVSDWLDDIPKLRIRADNMKKVVHRMPSNDYRREIKQLIGEIQRHKEEMPFVLSTEIVGRSFEENTRKMWKLLGDDHVSIIGIHGMGGVGKTLLATHVENEIKRKRVFKDVFWLTVSQNSTISKLQHDIAKRIGLKLDEDEERLRAANLCLALKEKENSVLVLDNVWNYIDFEKVGIPSSFKVIVTTRLKHVCQQMDCLPDNMIKMLPLQRSEAEELFMLKLGYNGKPAILSPQVEKIVQSCVTSCYRLPLKISVIARTMKGINDIYRWRHAKNKLEMGEEGEEVSKVLKSSYENLIEKNLKDCFLYIALLPSLERGELIMKLVDNKLINGKRSLEKIFDEGKTIFDKLKSHSLFWKRAATRNLASNILKESQRHVEVKFGRRLIEEWTKDLELVNCIDSDIEKMLEVLRACGSLKYVPPLGELQTLSRLVISHCSIDKVPEGLEKLINLKWLDLSSNKSLTGFVDVLCNLISLQYLDLRGCPHVKIKVEDVQGMKMLECFGGTFLDNKHYNHYVQNILDKRLGPETYHIVLTNVNDYFWHGKCILPNDPRTKIVHCLGDGDFSHSHILPEDVTDLYIYLSKYWDCLCDTLPRKTCSLKKINVVNCELKNVFCLSSSCFCCNTNFQYLEGLYLRKLDSLTGICKEDVLDVRQSLSMGAMFPFLKDLRLFRCHSIEKLLTPRLVLQLPNLERIYVHNCDSMQEIFAVDNGDGHDGSSSIVLPKLTTLALYELQQLKHVFNMSVLQLPNLESIQITFCQSMEEIFIMGNGDNDSSELPKFTTLVLFDLPQLKTLCNGMISFRSSPTFIIERCPNFDWIYPSIPFQLKDSLFIYNYDDQEDDSDDDCVIDYDSDNVFEILMMS